MRDIKFRGKRVDNGEWVYGYYAELVDIEHHSYWFSEPNGDVTDVIPETVGQYTGLNDRDGKEIYAGDICRWRDLETFNDEILEDIFVVVWNDEKLAWSTQNEEGNFAYELYEYIDDRDLEVIGNIYENKSLLEVAEDEI